MPRSRDPRDALLLIVALAAAAALRLPDLGGPPLSYHEGVFLYVIRGAGSLGEALTHATWPAYPPPFFFLQHLVHGPDPDRLAYRLPAAVQGLALVAVAAWLARRLLSPRRAWLATALVILSPACVAGARLASGHALLALAALVHVSALVALLGELGRGDARRGRVAAAALLAVLSLLAVPATNVQSAPGFVGASLVAVALCAPAAGLRLPRGLRPTLLVAGAGAVALHAVAVAIFVHHAGAADRYGALPVFPWILHETAVVRYALELPARESAWLVPPPWPSTAVLASGALMAVAFTVLTLRGALRLWRRRPLARIPLTVAALYGIPATPFLMAIGGEMRTPWLAAVGAIALAAGLDAPASARSGARRALRAGLVVALPLSLAATLPWARGALDWGDPLASLRRELATLPRAGDRVEIQATVAHPDSWASFFGLLAEVPEQPRLHELLVRCAPSFASSSLAECVRVAQGRGPDPVETGDGRLLLLLMHDDPRERLGDVEGFAGRARRFTVSHRWRGPFPLLYELVVLGAPDGEPLVAPALALDRAAAR